MARARRVCRGMPRRAQCYFAARRGVMPQVLVATTHFSWHGWWIGWVPWGLPCCFLEILCSFLQAFASSSEAGIIRVFFFGEQLCASRSQIKRKGLSLKAVSRTSSNGHLEIFEYLKCFLLNKLCHFLSKRYFDHLGSKIAAFLVFLQASYLSWLEHNFFRFQKIIYFR